MEQEFRCSYGNRASNPKMANYHLSRVQEGIEVGTTLEIEDTGEGLLLKKMVSTIDLIGTGKATQHDIFARLDKMRAEHDRPV
jgi:hypothetical protein